jgi:hypothetical protein
MYGCSVPVVLRSVNNLAGAPEYRFIGEAFVYGMMDGEVFEVDFQETSFKLV